MANRNVGVKHLAIVLAVFLFAALIGCGKSAVSHKTGTPDGDSPRLLAEKEQIKAYETPQGVDPAVFEALKAALISKLDELSKNGTSRTASAPPTGPSGQVTNLAYDAGTNTLSWDYANLGDYDVTSEVGVSDITPIALHYQASTTDGIGDDALEAWIDGDGSHEVGISDITPIAMNFQNNVSDYQMYTSDSAAGTFTPIGAPVPFGATGVFPKTFSVTVPAGALAFVGVAPAGAAFDPVGQPVIASTPPPGRGDWWMFGHDRKHTRRSQVVGTLAGATGPKWGFNAGAGVYSSPTIAEDGTIYVGSSFPANTLYAINPDGTQKWSYQDGYDIWSSPAIGQDGTIYFGGSNLKALDPYGNMKWYYSTPGVVQASPAVAVDGTIYVASMTGLFAVNPDGTEKWSYDTLTGSIISSPAIADDGTIYVGSGNLNFYAINPDGTFKWSFPAAGGITSSPAVASDGTIYFGTVWDGVSAQNSTLYAVNPNGTEQWNYLVGITISSSPGIGPNGEVCFGTDFGSFIVLNANGTFKNQYDVPGFAAIESSPAIDANGVTYFGDYEPTMYAYNVVTGQVEWSYFMGLFSNQFRSSPAIGADGTVYIGNQDGFLYAFGS